MHHREGRFRWGKEVMRMKFSGCGNAYPATSIHKGG
jgi:hypothetical protein